MKLLCPLFYLKIYVTKKRHILTNNNATITLSQSCLTINKIKNNETSNVN